MLLLGISSVFSHFLWNVAPDLLELRVWGDMQLLSKEHCLDFFFLFLHKSFFNEQ